ncbi:MAG: HNH endonuclease signature motif containing protein [Patescibacteria group bacterium]
MFTIYYNLYMAKGRSWEEKQLQEAVKKSFSYRQTLIKLGLRPTGGNYHQIKKYIKELKADTTHFKGKGWNLGLRGIGKPRIPTKKILVKNSSFQTYKVKQRLFKEGLKPQYCEECGWAEKTLDGYLPLELDHINGDRTDNRIKNLRILCPNCHSLKPTYRARKNKKKPG